MTAEQKYYPTAGYLALAAIAVPVIQLHVFHVFSYRMFFFSARSVFCLQFLVFGGANDAAGFAQRLPC